MHGGYYDINGKLELIIFASLCSIFLTYRLPLYRSCLIVYFLPFPYIWIFSPNLRTTYYCSLFLLWSLYNNAVYLDYFNLSGK